MNAFCLAILILVYFNIRRRRDQMLTEERLFLLLVWSDALILVTDSAMWLLDGVVGSPALFVNTIVTVLYFIMNPAICLFWYLYVDYQIYKDSARLKKLVLPMAVPAFVSLLLSVSSIFTGAMFYIDDANVYHRGRLFLIIAFIMLFYLACAWVIAMINRRRIPKQDFLPISLFMVLPVIGGTVQVIFYGLSVAWACVTISILIVFNHMQNIRLYTDHLTGLYNRRQLDRYLHQKISDSGNGYLAGLMIDVDDFKKINDMHGHSAGDQALVDTSEILRKTFRKNDFISRYGGDEFVVIMTVQEKEDLRKAIGRLGENVASFNARKTVPYTISLSVGYDCFLDQKDASAQEFIRRLDDLMYRDKHGGAKS